MNMDESQRSARMRREVVRTLKSIQRALPDAPKPWRNTTIADVSRSLKRELGRLASHNETERVRQVLEEVLHILSDVLPPRGSSTISDSIVEKRSEALGKLSFAIQLIDLPSDSLTITNIPTSGTEDGGLPGMLLTVEVGSAPPEAIADVLSDLSILYRRMGGSGINFTPQDVTSSLRRLYEPV